MKLESAGRRLAEAGALVSAAFLPLSIFGANWGMLLLLAGVALAWLGGRRGLLPSDAVWPVGAFVAACLLSTFVSPVELSAKSWIGWRPVLMVLLVPAAFRLSERPAALARRAVIVLLSAALLAALLGIWQRKTGFDLNYALGLRKAPIRIEAPVGSGFAAIGTFNSRLTFSAVQSALFVLALGIGFAARSLLARAGALAVALASGLAVAASYARAAWLGAIAGAALLLVGMRRRAAVALAALMVAGIAVGAAVPTVRERAVSAVHTGENQDRIFMWSRAGEVLADHPVLGVGVFGYPVIAGPYYDQHDRHFPMRTWTHDMYFTLLVETGPAGLVGYVWIFVVVAAVAFTALRGERGRLEGGIRLGALGASLSLLVASLFHDVLYDGEAALSLFFLAGLAIARLEGEPAAERK
jgi:O-antigen ligase